MTGGPAAPRDVFNAPAGGAKCLVEGRPQLCTRLVGDDDLAAGYSDVEPNPVLIGITQVAPLRDLDRHAATGNSFVKAGQTVDSIDDVPLDLGRNRCVSRDDPGRQHAPSSVDSGA
jgi:hypothetical protein